MHLCSTQWHEYALPDLPETYQSLLSRDTSLLRTLWHQWYLHYSWYTMALTNMQWTNQHYHFAHGAYLANKASVFVVKLYHTVTMLSCFHSICLLYKICVNFVLQATNAVDEAYGLGWTFAGCHVASNWLLLCIYACMYVEQQYKLWYECTFYSTGVTRICILGGYMEDITKPQDLQQLGCALARK